MSQPTGFGAGLGEVKFVSFSCCLPKRKNKFFTDELKADLHDAAAAATNQEPGSKVTFQDLKRAFGEARDAAKSVGNLVASVNAQMEKSTAFIRECVQSLIVALNMLKIIEESSDEPSSNAVQFLNEALEKLTAIAKTLKNIEAISKVVGELKVPTSREEVHAAVIKNAQIALAMNQNIREIHKELSEAQMAPDGVEISDLDKVDKAVKKMAALYLISEKVIDLNHTEVAAPVVAAPVTVAAASDAAATAAATDTSPQVVREKSTSSLKLTHI